MSFKKLHHILKDKLEAFGFETPTPLQKKVLPLIKGGSDAYIIAPNNSGKTTALILHTVNKLKAMAYEDSPRALIVVENKEKALALESAFKKYTNATDLRIYTVYDSYDIEKQKNEIYPGQDIIIATPARLSKLYFLNGIHIGEIQIFAIEDADYLGRNNSYNLLLRLAESTKKCQFIITADTMNPKITNYKNTFMSNALELVLI